MKFTSIDTFVVVFERLTSHAAISNSEGLIMPAVKLSETPGRITWGLPSWTGITRLAIALARGGTDRQCWDNAFFKADAWPDTPQVRQILQAARSLPLYLPVWAKAAVAPGTTADSTYAAPLVPFQTYASEYVEYLRPLTILGRIPGVRKIPFNVHMPRAIGGTSAGWVGEAIPKPLSRMSFDNIYLGFAKISAICALSDELIMFSSPAAEEVVSRDLSAAIIGFQDSSFIDPAVAAVADVSPASITNGITPIVSSGSTVAAIVSDVAAMFAAGIAGNVHFDNGCWVMHPRSANFLGTLLTTGGQRMWPEINIRGGMWYGLPVITSASVPIVGGLATVTLIDGGEVFLADDGGVTLSASNEAALQMLTNPATGATTQISLWQANLRGIKVERWENWARRHDAGVQVLESVAF